jgi:hypothetical protein
MAVSQQQVVRLLGELRFKTSYFFLLLSLLCLSAYTI